MQTPNGRFDFVAAILASSAMSLLGEDHTNAHAAYGKDISSPEGRAAIATETAVLLFTQIRTRLSQDIEEFQNQETVQK